MERMVHVDLEGSLVLRVNKESRVFKVKEVLVDSPELPEKTEKMVPEDLEDILVLKVLLVQTERMELVDLEDSLVLKEFKEKKEIKD